VDGVDPVDERTPGKSRLPTNSEVRYYSDDQLSSAQAIAASLTTRLTYPATVKKQPMPKKLANPVIEIWIGRRETEVWHANGS
jgi:hypothetical protein